jgi:hypothetical protein
MVGHQQQFGRVAEAFVCGEPGRIAMAVRADDRQVLDPGIELARDRAQRGIGRQQAVGMEFELAGQRPVLSACILAIAGAVVALTGEDSRA